MKKESTITPMTTASINLTILILFIALLIDFIREIIANINAVVPIKSVECTIFYFKIHVSNANNTTESIFNYMLIPILAGIIFNVYVFIREDRKK